ncbi:MULTISPECIES: YkvA family protein [unclassified Marinobacter]|uniref:YkvA family protein n=1 Tax=unclassified Marinobacter TaxID=83889 RepID=UPI0026E47878|nr:MULTISPECIES: YkvA family protein [unclassified Marinobacter]MDO6443314.1 YkvA family protein [Marinobacter sp. 2_MG-2023]MDO6824288.1 YkvA family protein [Marinobacter sp. 1_MG-2023]
MALFSQKDARKQLNEEAEKVSRADLETLLDRQQAIETKVKGSGKFERFSADIKLMFAMLRDYRNGSYRDIPWKSIAAVAGALLYVMNPLDLIPDLIVGIGFVDDVGVVALCLKLVESDLHKYAAWKELQEEVTQSTQAD